MRRLTLLLFALWIALPLSAQQPSPPSTQAATQEPLRTAGERPFDIRHIKLDLKVDLPKKTVDGQATLTGKSVGQLSSLRLDAVDFEVKKVAVSLGNGAKDCKFRQDGKNLLITFDPPPSEGSELSLKIDYRVSDPKAGLHFFGPTPAEPNVPLTVWSQGEPVTNRHWIPCLDQPNQRQSSELVATVAEGFEVLSNGALVEKRTNNDKTVTFHWRQEQPHPSYLITMVVGKFDIVQEKWNDLPVLYYVPQGKKNDVARTFGRTREMLDFFSRRFGVAYPWEKYAQVVVEQFNAGGMENTSATTLTDRAIHDERAILDSSPDPLIAHELAHQWWGNLVTCRDWAHLWLNEGFASYAEALWDEHAKGRDAYAYNMLQKSRPAMSGGKDRPVVDRRYASPVTMFDSRAYPKGAFILHMLRQRIGDRAFFEGLRTYATEHKFRSVETADFRKTMERVSGQDLEHFFFDWSERPGHPVVDVSSEYDDAGKALRLTVRQTQAGEPFHFPLKIAYQMAGDKGGNGAMATVTEKITTKEQRVTIPLASRPALLELDPNQEVLGELKETKPQDWLLGQLRQGTVVSQIRAIEQLGRTKSQADQESLVKEFQTGNDKVFWGVRVEMANTLGSMPGAASRDALIAGLKNENPKVRRACADQLGNFAKDDKAAAALREVLTKGDASYFVEAAALSGLAKLKLPNMVPVMLPWLAKESHGDVLRMAALNGLGQSQDLSALDTLISWTDKGKPRSARMAALMGLSQVAKAPNAAPHREKILKTLTTHLEGDNLTMRRGAVQALAGMGPIAAPALPALDVVASRDTDGRLAELAKTTAAKLRAPGQAGAENTKLREELEGLKKSHDALKERLEKLEKAKR